MNQYWQRISGIFGVLGGIVLFVGDMLFYYDPESADILLNMGNASDSRIMVSAVTSLFAAWFYVLGLGQINYAFQPTKANVRNTVLISMGAVLISYGVIHGAFVAIATSAKLATEHQLDIAESTRLAVETNNLLRLIIYPIFTLLSFLFIFNVWKKKTLYPRWMILFFPLIPFLILKMFGGMLTGPAFIIITRGGLNLMLILFFAVSTIALWNIKQDEK